MSATSVQSSIALRVLDVTKDTVTVQPMLPVTFGLQQTEGEVVPAHTALDCSGRDVPQGKIGDDTANRIELTCGKRRFLVLGVTFNATN